MSQSSKKSRRVSNTPGLPGSRVEKTPFDLTKTEGWNHFVHTSTRISMVGFMVRRIRESLHYNADEAVNLARQIERYIFVAATSVDEYMVMGCNQVRERSDQWLHANSSLLPFSDVPCQSAMATLSPPITPPNSSQHQRVPWCLPSHLDATSAIAQPAPQPQPSSSWSYLVPGNYILGHGPQNHVNSFQESSQVPNTSIATLEEPVSTLPPPPFFSKSVVLNPFSFPSASDGFSLSSGCSSAFASYAPPSPSTGFWGGDILARAMMPTWSQINAKIVPLSSSKIPRSVDLMEFRRKLESGMYANVWDFIEDIWMEIDRAKMFYKRVSGCGSNIYCYWSEIAELLEIRLNEVMQHKLGYCCGNFYKFDNFALKCAGNGCEIRAGQPFYHYKEKTAYCTTCFEKVPDMINIALDLQLDDDIAICSEFVQASRFIRCENNIQPELFVTCVRCLRRHHLICVRHFEKLSPGGFTCRNCLPTAATCSLSLPRARDLPTC